MCCAKDLLAYLPLGCFQNLFSLISSAALLASSSCCSLTRTFKVDRKVAGREKKREK